MARKRTTESPAKPKAKSTTPAKPKAKPTTPSKPKQKPKSAPAKVEKGNTVFTLKIALKWLKPEIWRRVEVPDCTLEELHWVIQLCMPWTNSHMWEFTVGRERYGMDMNDDPFSLAMEDDSEPAYTARLSDLVAAGVKRFAYLYDFGDSWDHVITFERPVARDPKAKYPRCVAGQYACPPDDCGGASGYAQLLDILADKNHPDHEDMLEWAGGPIDGEAFDLGATNKSLLRFKLK